MEKTNLLNVAMVKTMDSAAVSMGDCTVCVQGIANPDGSTLSDEMLRLAFESPRCGGGPVESVEVDSNNNVACITFVNSSSKW